jgi:acyl-CoA synthetase (AMP-forming)/AMP-acid ligase II
VTAPGAPDPACAGLLPLLPAREDARALHDAAGGGWLARAALRTRVLDLAAQLRPGRKRLVFLLARNDAASVIALLAAAAAGHAIAVLAPTMADDQRQAMLAAYRPDLLLASVPIGIPGWNEAPIADGSITAASAPDEQPGPPIAPELLILLSTSGTTGSRKFVRLSAAAMAANASQIAAALGIRGDDVGIAHLPLHYSYGLSIVTSHLVAGAAVAPLEGSVITPEFWAQVEALGGTHFPGVPFHYTTLNRLGIARLAPPSVRCFTQAGGALDVRVQRAVHAAITARGGEFFVMYGQTEAGPRITTLPSARLAEKFGSVGPALAGGSLSILGPDGSELPPGEVGEVVYRGPNVMLGYAETRADLSRGDDANGRLETGDLGYLDEDGYLFLTGRAKRFAKVFGLRISLDEVERRMARHVACAAVDVGERIALLHEPIEETALRQAIKAIAEEYQLPQATFIAKPAEALPVTDNGKIDYVRVRELV